MFFFNLVYLLACILLINKNFNGAMGLSLGIASMNEFFTFREVVFQYCWSINSAGPEIQKKIQKDCKTIKQLCFFVFIANLLVYATFLPLVGDEGDIIYVVMLARRYFGDWANLSCSVYYFCFLCFAYGNIVVLFICAYIIFHLRFQFYLIIEHMQTLSDDYDLENGINYDDSYQKSVRERMVLCVNQHVNIKRVTRMFSHITRLPIAGVTIIASSVFVATAFFIVSEISPHSNFRMCLSSISCFTILMSVCSFGEMLAEESNHLYRICLESPWPFWNRENQHCLMMLMLGCSQPLKITFYNLLDLNYSFLLKIISITYKLQALFMKYK
ncbi:uncharacterized protein LOC108910291 [Anoplophora glabripennis]|uniref:uncharacterized protein LOC108910291 n=1 Tax=Anoplophora glabripennis TaxID=217634 RepID=UPI000873633D|nr:uncharacterized protein LOC108910291 [Anoplophora glabripennis]